MTKRGRLVNKLAERIEGVHVAIPVYNLAKAVAVLEALGCYELANKRTEWNDAML